MRLLNEEQLEQILEITRKGNAVEGTVLYKLAFDIKRVRSLMLQLVEAKSRNRGFFSNKSFCKESKKIIEEIEDIL
jgi:uncharacterized protein YfkK (UPF0435 family)|tara:strand:+ start:4633 stop:4860 length:228 start_codon:yes stop_codon:yes gene_type:complete